jgi:hypothetical protein
VRHGNGWLAVTAPPDRLSERLGVLSRIAAEAGRPLGDISLVYKLFLDIGEAKRGPFGSREPGTGSQAEIIDDIKRLFDLGFTQVIVRYRGADPAELTRQIDRFVGEIVPRV